MTDEQETPCAGARSHDPGDPVWCPACAEVIAEHLAALRDLVAALEGEVDDGQAGALGGDPVSGTKATPSPSSAVDDIDEITRLLEFWEDAHREHAGQPFRPARPPARRVPAAVAYLGQHLGAVLAAPYAEEFGRDINRAHARARRRTAQDTARARKPIPCPSCDLLALEHTAGSKWIECRSCERLIGLDEYDTWTRLAAAGARTSVRSSA